MNDDIRSIKDMNQLISYFSHVLHWDIDIDSFSDINDIAYDFDASDLGLKEESFAKIRSVKQLPPLVDKQPWGIFSVEFDSKKFEVTALRKVLSGLIPKNRNSANHAVWEQDDLLFLCFWGEDNNRTIGVAHFEDKEIGLPQIKMIYCSPAIEDTEVINRFVLKLGNLTWPIDVHNHTEWHDNWARAFVTAYKQTIRDSETLTNQLASEAIGIRDRILETLNVETEDGYVHRLYEKFKDTLIHDMTETQFADMYAQTVVYGLFSARCMDSSQEDFSATEAVDCIPNTNPFLKNLMKECLGAQEDSKLSFDELEIGNVVDLLEHTKTDEIISDFNRQTGSGKEDTVIHFYEKFLEAYDKTQKVQRGVFYTPQPVVNFMVRAVDSIIKTEFDLVDGLASTERKRVRITRQSKRTVDGYHYKQVEDSIEVPAIQILDPATGTGTFLRQIILHIYESFKNSHRDFDDDELKCLWNEYVPEHLLPRLNAFELMMAPYAVAHMKLALTLKETGYEFNSDERLNVYLTNSLEEPGNSEKQMSIFEEDPLTMESIEANGVKKNCGINVVIGNPPYSTESSNTGEWITRLMDDFKKEPGGVQKLKERNYKSINGDENRFIRYAIEVLKSSDNGILAFITPHGYLSNPTFRGMRWYISQFFDSFYIVDLNGNVRKTMTGDIVDDKDENVFDIKQGVAISIFVRKKKGKKDYNFIDIKGTREYKYDFLNTKKISDINWVKIEELNQFYSFRPSNFSSSSVFYDNPSLRDVFTNNSIGIVTGDDKNLVKDSEGDFSDAINVEPFDYRLFDKRYIKYDTNIQRPRDKTMQHMRLGKQNYALCIGGTAKNEYPQCFISKSIVSKHFVTSETYVLPLYTYNGIYKIPNISNDFAQSLSNRLGIPYNAEACVKDLMKTITPIDVFDYTYAYLYSSVYRNKYSDELKMSFPCFLFPYNKEMFFELSQIGESLRNLHLGKGCLTDGLNIVFDGYIGESIQNVRLVDDRVFINNNHSFSNIERSLYEFYIGGSQPLQKWFKTHKGTLVTSEFVNNAVRIANIISETIKLISSVDLILENE